MDSLETATEHLLHRTRRQAAELSRLIAQLEQLQGDIRRHHESRGRPYPPAPDQSTRFEDE